MSKKTVGQISRLPQILDKAAELFGTNGYRGTTIRDIMSALDMPSGSLYYHFPSKEDLLVAVYKVGVQHVLDCVEQALTGETDAWVSLEKACAAHLKAVLEDNSYAKVICRIVPEDVSGGVERLTELRDVYEAIFIKLIRDLALPPEIDKKSLRMLLLGGMNWSQIWYQPGRDSPEAIATKFVEILKKSLTV